MPDARTIQDLKEIISPVADYYGVERVYLFGSRARGDNRPNSDYDFLISKGCVDSLFKHAALRNALEDALQSPVDLITDTSNDRQLIDNAKKDAVLIYERQKKRTEYHESF